MPTIQNKEAAISRLLSHFGDELTTMPILARKMGVSTRSVYRYVRELRDQGVPIRSSRGVGTMLKRRK